MKRARLALGITRKWWTGPTSIPFVRTFEEHNCVTRTHTVETMVCKFSRQTKAVTTDSTHIGRQTIVLHKPSWTCKHRLECSKDPISTSYGSGILTLCVWYKERSILWEKACDSKAHNVYRCAREKWGERSRTRRLPDRARHQNKVFTACQHTALT